MATGRARQALVVVSVTVLLIAGLQFLVTMTGQAIGTFTRDPATIAGLPWYTGAVGLGTSVLWFVGASLALVAATGAGRERARLRLLGVLMLLLGAKDLFTLQEAFTSWNIPPGTYYSLYVLLGLAMTWQFRTRPFDMRTVAFAGGVVLLAISLACDFLALDALLVEDGAKLMGIVLWCLIPLWSIRERLERVGERNARDLDARHRARTPVPGQHRRLTGRSSVRAPR